MERGIQHDNLEAQMIDFISDRAKRLELFCNNLRVDLKFPLLIGHKLSNVDFTNLKNYVIIYLYESLCTAFHKEYVLCDDFFERYQNDIEKLPNITPNGLLLPKTNNMLAYNLLYKYAVSIIQDGRLCDLDRIHAPINVRIINGQPNEALDKRKRSSTKWHSDIWAGEFSNHISCHVHLFGQPELNGIAYAEPNQTFCPKYVKPLDDYDDGQEVMENVQIYDADQKLGWLYFSDSFLMHKTLKRCPGLRLTLNLTFMTESILDSDIEHIKERNPEYIDKDQWYKIGTSKFYTTAEVIRNFSAEEMQIAKNHYSGSFTIKSME